MGYSAHTHRYIFLTTCTNCGLLRERLHGTLAGPLSITFFFLLLFLRRKQFVKRFMKP